MIGSASGNVGPFAASPIILHCNFFAMAGVIWFSSAPGTRMSHFVVSNCSVVIFLLPGKPTTVPFFSFCASYLLTLNPLGTWIEPWESLAAIHSAPIFSRYSPENVDALPNPCKTTVAPFNLIFKILAASLIQ